MCRANVNVDVHRSGQGGGIPIYVASAPRVYFATVFVAVNFEDEHVRRAMHCIDA